MGISAGVILCAIFAWIVLAGMKGKQGIDNLVSRHEERQEDEFYQPIQEWWARYGVSEQECESMMHEYTKSLYNVGDVDLKNRIYAQIRANIDVPERAKTADDLYLLWLLDGKWKEQYDREIIITMYYATMGRVARFKRWDSWERFPMAYFPMNRGTEPIIKKLFEEHGVQDTFGFGENPVEQRRRLEIYNRERGFTWTPRF